MPSGYREVETFGHLTEVPLIRSKDREALAVKQAREALADASALYGSFATDRDWAGVVGAFQAAVPYLLRLFEELQTIADRAGERAR